MTPFSLALHQSIQIATVDFTRDSIEITFTNGIFAVYHAQHLFDTRSQDHNGSMPVKAHE